MDSNKRLTGGAGQADWRAGLPAHMVAVDVETTGLYPPKDRVVSIGIVSVKRAEMDSFPLHWRGVHLLFNPGRPSHPRALAVHGLADGFLAQQEPFHLRGAAIRDFIAAHEMLVMHNAEFDLGFINSEFTRMGLAALDMPFACTMRGWEAAKPGGYGLDAVCASLKLPKSGGHHGAMEDAWLAMQVYLHLNGAPELLPPPLQHPKFAWCNAQAQAVVLDKTPPPPQVAAPRAAPPNSHELDKQARAAARKVVREKAKAIIKAAEHAAMVERNAEKRALWLKGDGPEMSTVGIGYVGARGEVSCRVIDVWSFAEREGLTHINAWCHKRNALRQFLLTGILYFYDPADRNKRIERVRLVTG